MKGMKKIGQGSFSSVYKKNNKKVLIKSRDPIKECMALGWFPNSRYFPKIKTLNNYSVNGYSLYEMRFLSKVKAVKQELLPDEYEKYRQLRKVASITIGCKHNYPNNFKKNMEIFVKNRRLRNVVLEAYDACRNYSDNICFEISPRNIAISNGKLILLDCFFDKDLLWTI